MLKILDDAPLGERTTLGLGGRATRLIETRNVEETLEALQSSPSLPAVILGGGSNLVVSDEGVDALVIRPFFSDLSWEKHEDEVLVRAGAGLNLDDVIAESTRKGLWGLENLSGVPGSVGAAPVQNVGAYGVEIADILESVEILDLATGRLRSLDAEACHLGYRSSLFRRHGGASLITALSFRLSRRPQPRLEYEALSGLGGNGSLSPALIRERVLEIRRARGMLLEDGCPSSAGSFFINPLVDENMLEELCGRLQEALIFRKTAEGKFRIPAARLIEAAGFPKGLQRGPVGISAHHALALVHHGGGKTADLLELARDIQSAVEERFRIHLEAEPVFWGFGDEHPLG